MGKSSKQNSAKSIKKVMPTETAIIPTEDASDKPQKKQHPKKILICGDRTIDRNIIIRKKNVGNYEINLQLDANNIDVIERETGFKLLAEVIKEFNTKMSSVWGNNSAKWNNIDEKASRLLCFDTECVNYANYTWNEIEDNEFFRDKFLGAKYFYDYKESLDEHKPYGKYASSDDDKDNDFDLVVLYDRASESTADVEKGKKFIEQIKKIIDKNKDKKPYIFFRLLYPSENPSEKEKSKGSDENSDIVKYLQLNGSKEKTLLLLKLEDLRQMGADIPISYTWEELIRQTSKELRRLRKVEASNLLKAAITIIEFDYDGYAAFHFDENENPTSCHAVFNCSQINNNGFKETSKHKGGVPSTTTIMQAIITNYFCKVIREKPSEDIFNEFTYRICKDEAHKNEGCHFIDHSQNTCPQEHIQPCNESYLTEMLKVCYLTTYYYSRLGRYFSENAAEFDLPFEEIGEFIKIAIKFLNKNENETRDAFLERLEAERLKEENLEEKKPKAENSEEEKSEAKKAEEEKAAIEKKFVDFIEENFPRYIHLQTDFFYSETQTFVDILKDNNKYSYNQIAKSIVEAGLYKNKKIQNLPYMVFENLVSIENEEIKSYRHIHDLIKQHIESDKSTPCSICVFGPPGAGKSFGVEQVLEHIKTQYNKEYKKDNSKTTKKIELENMTFNLSQLDSVEELHTAFRQSSNTLLLNKIPVVFWDEFDAPMNGKEYGWLKYFLSPLQDGEYFDHNMTQIIGKAIYIFAGSTADSWDEFIKRAEDKGKVPKGIDFISRISAYVDVLGTDAHPCDMSEMYKLRRAVILRGCIERSFGIGRSDKFDIDGKLLKAMINVEKYKHGSRSVKRLVQEFKNIVTDKKHIKKYGIPNQLDLYVEEADFREYLKEEI